MQANATNAAVKPRPLVFAGLPASSWIFALRIWLAVVITLFVSFWLELEAPAAAATAVGIAALPTRAQGIEKAVFMLLATVVGVAASVAIAGFFSQTGALLLAVLSVCVGLCVYAVGMLDGNRAFAAAYCCITIGLIAVQQIDSPQQVFLAAVERGVALAVGAVAAGFVNDILTAPDYYPVLSGRLDALHRRVVSYVESVLRGEAVSARTAAVLLHDIAAIRPEIASLNTESSSGRARSAAARTALVNLVAELSLARTLAEFRVTPAMHSSNPDGSSGLMMICHSWLRQELTRKNADVRGSLDALRDGTHLSRQWRASLYRSRAIAGESGVRAAIHFALIAILLAIAGWPETEICLSYVAFIIGLSYIAPDAREFTALAIAATAIACLLAGVLKYFIFNGLSGFPVLAIGLAPVVVGLTLMIPVPKLSWLGRITLIFTLVVLDPANPQDYGPQDYLVTSFLVCLAAILSFAAHLLILPLPSDRRLQRLLDEARLDLSSSLDVQRHPHLAPEEATFRDATRIERIVTSSNASPLHGHVVDEAMYCFDQAATLRRCNAELDRLETGPLAGAALAARRALVQRDRHVMLTAAEALRKNAAQRGLTTDSACAALALAGVICGHAQSVPQSASTNQP